MRQQVTREIEGHTYEFSQFGARESLKVLGKLTKIIGEPLTLGLSGVKGGGNFLGREIDLTILGRAVGILGQHFDDEAISLIESLTSGDRVLCDGKKVDFLSHYEGKLDLMFKVLYAALEVQYGNFFKGLTALAPATPPAPSTSTPQ